MDNGSKHDNSGYILNTQNFTYHENNCLLIIFKENFNIKVSIWKDKNNYKLYIQSKSVKLFNALVMPYMHSDFMYKIIPKL